MHLSHGERGTPSSPPYFKENFIMVDITEKDFLLVVDMQNDFINGSLAVPGAASIIPVINTYLEKIQRRAFSKDMHPKNHSSFKAQGGQWPQHCVVGTQGSELHKSLDIDPKAVMVVRKGTEADRDAYSAFDGTGLDMVLPSMLSGVKRIFVCGLATDYCVKATVLDAIKLGIKVYVLKDAIKAVNVKPGDGDKAIKEMEDAGAIFITLADVK